MKLGSDTTNYRNHVLGQPWNEPAPVVGMGATILRRVDRLACTIVRVFQDDGRTFVVVQVDADEETSAPVERSGSSYQAKGELHVFGKTRAGHWEHVRLIRSRKSWMVRSSHRLRLDLRETLRMPDDQGPKDSVGVLHDTSFAKTTG